MTFWRRKPPNPKRFYCIVMGYDHKSASDGIGCFTLSVNVDGGDDMVLSQEGRKSLVRYLDYGEA